MRISDWSSDVCSSDLGQMIAGAEADVIVVGLVGERSREVSDFLATKLPGAVRQKSVVVAVPADHAPLLRLRAAMRATTIAEYFRSQGLKVMLLMDSLTRVAHAQREIGLSLGEPPTVKGYPPSKSEEHTSELQSLMRISYAVFCLKKKNQIDTHITNRKLLNTL